MIGAHWQETHDYDDSRLLDPTRATDAGTRVPSFLTLDDEYLQERIQGLVP